MAGHCPYLFLIIFFYKREVTPCCLNCCMQNQAWLLIFYSNVLVILYFLVLYFSLICDSILIHPFIFTYCSPTKVNSQKPINSSEDFMIYVLHMILSHKSEFFTHINCGILFPISIYFVLSNSILSS